jgi:hypothetical protein
VRRVSAAVLAAFIAIGCASPVPSSSSAVPPVFVDLPTLSGVAPAVPSGVPYVCAGVGFSDSVLHGAPEAEEAVWLESVAQPPKAFRVRWPAGFRARFSPGLELLDASGATVAREGDLLTMVGGYPEAGAGSRFDIWEFNGRRYPCY